MMKLRMLALAALLAVGGCGKKEPESSLAERIEDAAPPVLRDWLIEYEDDRSGLGDMLSALRDKEPALYAEVADNASNYMYGGEEPERAAYLAVNRHAESPVLLKYAPHARDADLKDFLTISVEELRQLQQNDPMLCATSQPGTVIPRDKEPVGAQNRRYAALARIMRQPDPALHTPTPEERQAWADSLNERHPDVVAYIQNTPDMGRPTPETAAEMCRVMVTLIEEMANDPVGLAAFRAGIAQPATP